MNPMVLPGLVAPSRPLVASGHEKASPGEGFRDALSRSEKGHRHDGGRSPVKHERAAENADPLDLKADTEVGPAEDDAIDGALLGAEEATPAKRQLPKQENEKPDAPIFAQGATDKTPPPPSPKAVQLEGTSLVSEEAADLDKEPSLDIAASSDTKEPAPTPAQETTVHVKNVRRESATPSLAESEPPQTTVIQAEPKIEATDASNQSEPRNIHLRASANIAAMLATRAAPSQIAEKTAVSGDVRQIQDGSSLRVIVNARSNPEDRFFDIREKSFGSAVAMLHLSKRTHSGTASAALSRTTLRQEASHTTSVDGLSGQTMDTTLETRVQADDSQTEDRPADDRADRRDRDSRSVQSADKASAKSSEPTLPSLRSETVASVAEPLAAAAKPIGRTSAAVTVETQAQSASGTQTLKIQLRPVELGEITAVLRMNGDSMTVEISTEKIEAYDRLTSDSDNIVKALRGLGLQVDQVTVQPPQAVTASAKGDAGASNQPASGSGQQFAQTGGSSGEGSGGQRGTASQGAQRDDLQARNSAVSSAEDRGNRGLVI